MPGNLFKAIVPATGLLALLLAGCQSASFAGRDSLPYPAVEDRPVSLAFNSPVLEAAGRQVTPYNQVAEIPWYFYRNDMPLSTEAGYSGPVYEQTYNYTYDQQIQSNGRVHDYYSSTTYRTRFSQTVR